jgi:arylsulfatase A-like enzyme
MFPEEFESIPEEDVVRYGRVIPAAYRLADQTLGRFLRLIDEDTTVMVLSDHGFGPMDPDPIPILNIKLVMKTIDVPGYIVPMRVGRRWYLTSKDRQNKGVPQHVIERLSAAYIEETEAPLFGVTEFPGYIRVRLPRYLVDLDGTGVFPGLASFKLSELLEYDSDKVNSGTHHDDGIVILHGKRVRSGAAIEGMGLLDVVPTLLALAGLPVARDMDGEAKVEAIDEAFLQAHPVSFIESYETGDEPEEPEEEMTEEEREKVMGRLEALGYL